MCSSSASDTEWYYMLRDYKPVFVTVHRKLRVIFNDERYELSCWRSILIVYTNFSRRSWGQICIRPITDHAYIMVLKVFKRRSFIFDGFLFNFLVLSTTFIQGPVQSWVRGNSGLRFLDHCFGFVSSARRVVFHTSGAGCSKLDYSANPGLKFNLLF